MPEAKDKFFLVGVGASAGGLDALTKLVANLPKNAENFAVIIAQHLSPDYKSRMVDLLSRTSRWKVLQAEDDQKIEAKMIYMTPPENEVAVQDGKIKLTQHHRDRHSVPSIDQFFESLAAEYKNFSIGIVMSGTGSDGTKGSLSIKEKQGYVLVQDPEEAQHNSMPSSVIKEDAYHKILLAENMGEEIRRYLENHKVVDGGISSPPQDSMKEIFKLMTKKTGTDFSRYKPSTIKRRIQRRLDALDIKSIDDYRQHIQQSPTELDELFKTVLIGVTGFFRDEKAFEALRGYIKKILQSKRRGDTVRVWSVGCATGEEPYSIAIMLEELLEQRKSEVQIQIFATDIDEYALNMGRRGYYTHEQVSDMPRDLLHKYFNSAPNGYEIKKHIRQRVLFSKHDISVDPPFVRLDLVTCRNLLIYFDNELQKEIIPIFHYALNEDGYLLLGKSENVSDQTDLFGKAEGKQKIFFRKKGAHNTLRFSKFRSSTPTSKKDEEPQPRPEMTVEEIAEQTLVRTYDHPYVVVDENLDVVYIKGKMQPYTELDEGAIDSNLLRIVNKNLHMELRSLFARSKKKLENLKGSSVRLKLNGEDHYVRPRIKPLLYTRNESRYFMFIFEEVEEHFRMPTDDEYTSREEDWKAMRITELEQELSATKEHLHTFTEELETSNEELQSLNEELQSTNEELKSSNEELETSNEELQSANEELSTANSELNHSNEELLQKENELLSIKEDLELVREKFHLALENTSIFLFYQDADLDYGWVYNPFASITAEAMIGKNDLELGSLDSEKARELHNIKQQAMEQQNDTQLEIQIGKEWYDLKIMPHIQKGKTIGLYGIGIGITERKTAADAIEHNETILRSIINQGADNILAVDTNFKVLSVNHNMQDEFSGRYQVSIHQGDNLIQRLQKYPEQQQTSREHFERTFKGEVANIDIFKAKSPDGKSEKYYEGVFFPLYNQEDKIIGGANIGRDVTDRVILEQQVQDIVKRSAHLTGNEFFKDLTSQLATVFNMNYVYVGTYREEENTMQTLALRSDGKLSENFTYTLPQTPCGLAINREKQIHLEGVRQQFPNDPKLARWNVESYVGIPIESSQSKKSLGVLVMMDDEPWKSSPFADYLLALFSLRAGAELERMRAEQEIREKSAQLDNITSNVPGALYELAQTEDNQVVFSYISENCNVILELSQEELYQDADRILDLMHDEDKKEYPAMHGKAISDMEAFTFECRITTAKTGRFKWVKFDSRAIRNEKGETFWYGFIEDITTFKKITSELVEAKETAERAAQAKDDFLSTMSHEIRTPLNAIIGLSQLLLRRKPRPDQLENLSTLKFSSESLMSLINDILDFNKLEADNMEVDKANYQLADLLESIRQAHLPYADELGNQIVLKVDKSVPETLIGDPMKLGQVLNNLISNANKFTSNGKVEVDVSLVARDKNWADIRFAVKDNGIGITKEKVNRIFEKFTQADSSTQRQYGGTGLGLSITRSLLRLMDAEIEVNSQPNEGSEFHFLLRQQVGEKQELDTSSIFLENDKSKTTQQNVRILLVEDVAINRMVIQQYLEELWNLEADEAVNGLEAVAMAEKDTYDLILMDIRMPEMDGREATAKIRTMGNANAKVPILALTADVNVVRQDDMFTDVVTKPFNPDDLLQKILSYTDSANQSKDTPDEEAPEHDFAQSEANLNMDEEKTKQFYKLALKSIVDFKNTYSEAIQQEDQSKMGSAMHKARLLFSMLEVNDLYDDMNKTREKMKAGAKPEVLNDKLEQHEQSLNELVARIQKRLSDLSETSSS